MSERRQANTDVARQGPYLTACLFIQNVLKVLWPASTPYLMQGTLLCSLALPLAVYYALRLIHRGATQQNTTAETQRSLKLPSQSLRTQQGTPLDIMPGERDLGDEWWPNPYQAP